MAKASVRINRIFETRLYIDWNSSGSDLLLDLKAINAVTPSLSSGGGTTKVFIQGQIIEIHERYDVFSKLWRQFKEQL